MKNIAPAISWLKSQKDKLDYVIAEVGHSYNEILSRRPNASYDLKVATDESYRLSRGQDLCYDRPSVGLVYGLWYHARRVNTSLPLCLESLAEYSSVEKIQIYDLGAGTGAVQWAMALTCGALKSLGMRPPKIHVVNVDTSPFMLQYLSHLWNFFETEFDFSQYISYTNELNTWQHIAREPGNTWVFSSYLFDHEDKKEALTEDFRHLIDVLKPSRIVLSTSAQRKKVQFLESISSELKTAGFLTRAINKIPPFSGELHKTNKLRARLQQEHPSIRPNATWQDHSFCSEVFVKRKEELPFTPEDSKTEENLSLFMPREIVRRNVELSSEQKKAAVHDGVPTLIHGPAGCGKSVVITERIKNLIEASKFDPSLRILLTTFNKALTKDVLYTWLREILGEKQVTWEPYKSGSADETCFLGKFSTSDKPNIFLMHFDVLPTRLGLVHLLDPRQVAYGYTLRHHAEVAVEKARQLLLNDGYTESELTRVLDPDFLIEEYHRVWYGLFQTREKEFLSNKRPGRPRFNKNSKPRQALWTCLQTFMKELDQRGCTTFTARRRYFYQFLNPKSDRFSDRLHELAAQTNVAVDWLDQTKKKIADQAIEDYKPNDYSGLFTHVFIDEMQDCTHRDFAIFYRLLADFNEIVVAGDLAQAVHMGRSASSVLPRLKKGNQKNKKTHELQGSYRLPFRISEALIPLSERIHDKRESCKDQVEVSLQTPYRGSPPGARPIVVWAEDEATMARKISSICHAYSWDLPESEGFTIDSCTILETDRRLFKELDILVRKKVKSETSTILRLKGLEKPCVIWSTRMAQESDEEVEEYVYTILTRSASILIIALFPDTHSSYFPILNTFCLDRIIAWDADSVKALKGFQRDRPFNNDIEEHADPEV